MPLQQLCREEVSFYRVFPCEQDLILATYQCNADRWLIDRWHVGPAPRAPSAATKSSDASWHTRLSLQNVRYAWKSRRCTFWFSSAVSLVDILYIRCLPVLTATVVGHIVCATCLPKLPSLLCPFCRADVSTGPVAQYPIAPGQATLRV